MSYRRPLPDTHSADDDDDDEFRRRQERSSSSSSSGGGSSAPPPLPQGSPRPHHNNENAAAAAGPPKPTVLTTEQLAVYMKQKNLMDLGIGGRSAVWSVSSAKHGSGVANVIDGFHLDTFWQSDGVLPHTLRLQLPVLTAVATVAVFLDFTQDESYTPRQVHVRAGTHVGDVEVVASVEIDQPCGWVLLQPAAAVVPPPPLPSLQAATVDSVLQADAALVAAAADQWVWCTLLEVLFKENHHNGRDCHVRGVRVLGPRPLTGFADAQYAQSMELR